MNIKDSFYQQRDMRSVEYGVSDSLFEKPVAITIDSEAAESEHGQLIIISLINMLSRFHRHISVACPDVRLVSGRPLLPYHKCLTLHEAIYSMAVSIDPYIDMEFDIDPNFQAGIGIGKQYNQAMPWYIGIDSNMIFLDTKPVSFKAGQGFSLGACMSSCIAASVIIKQLIGMHLYSGKFSAWNLKEDSHVRTGPQCLDLLDVGSVFMIGAGGVGSCLVYWLRQSGYRGRWTIVDGDVVELHNSNRSLGILPSDAGWPDNEAKYKAQTAARLVDASYYNAWYDDIIEEAYHADLILPLANEKGVRNKISQRGDTILLHATTSKNWEAQLHRHIAGEDDCIVCRMPKNVPNLICSTVELPDGSGGSSDAALPFLSASAGFLLLNGLYRLMYDDLTPDKHNWWRMIFNSTRMLLASGRCKCLEDCSTLLPRPVRDAANKGKRWACLEAIS